ncbi:MAG: hypothetical protein NTZ59_10705 [Bacteroidetes bacterium]|nr:hypothetical protein [Bacteroidota bacterium]
MLRQYSSSPNNAKPNVGSSVSLLCRSIALDNRITAVDVDAITQR